MACTSEFGGSNNNYQTAQERLEKFRKKQQEIEFQENEENLQEMQKVELKEKLIEK